MRKRISFLTTAAICIGILAMGGTPAAASMAVPEETTEDYIIPYSDSRYLTEEEIEDMSAQELNYARNEIYARHRRKFASLELQNYFDSQRWYMPYYSPEDFPDDITNEYEKYNSQLLYDREYEICPGGYPLDTGVEVSIFGDTRSNYEKMLNGKIVRLGSSFLADVDGDGREDEVNMTADYSCDPSPYVLTINGNQISGSMESLVDGVYGVSLDGETIALIIYSNGPSDDPTSVFYTYSPEGIQKSGEIYDTPWNISVGEDGTIYGNERCNIIDTAQIKKNWSMQGKTLIENIPDYYSMYNFLADTEYYAYLKNSLEVYENMDLSSNVSTLTPQNVKFPYTDAVEWVYVQGETGNGGWINMNSWNYETGWELFDGLRLAD